MKKLLVIDAMNVIRPLFEVIPGDPSIQKAIGAFKSAMQVYRKLVNTFDSTHCVWCFEGGGATWRHTLNPTYKSTRTPTPAELLEAVPSFRAQLDTLAISIPCWEADDIINTVVQQALQDGCFGEIVVASTDKDIASLGAAETVQVYNWQNKSMNDNAWCQKKYGVELSSLLELLALMGDATDCIPGIAGVGRTIGANWLNTYGNLDEVLRNEALLKHKVGQTFRDSHVALALSRELTQLRKVPDTSITWAAAEIQTL